MVGSSAEMLLRIVPRCTQSGASWNPHHFPAVRAMVHLRLHNRERDSQWVDAGNPEMDVPCQNCAGFPLFISRYSHCHRAPRLLQSLGYVGQCFGDILSGSRCKNKTFPCKMHPAGANTYSKEPERYLALASAVHGSAMLRCSCWLHTFLLQRFRCNFHSVQRLDPQELFPPATCTAGCTSRWPRD